MLKIKVIADNVLNLTDARYFAAFGVDFLVFNLANISHEAVKEICEWVEGVEVLLEIDEALSPEVLDFIIQTKPAGIVSSSWEILTSVKDQLPEKSFFLRSENGGTSEEFDLIILNNSIDEITRANPNQKIFVKTTNVEEAMSSPDIEGIVVEGEPEEKVGFKNFDELDDLFDKLMIEY